MKLMKSFGLATTCKLISLGLLFLLSILLAKKMPANNVGYYFLLYGMSNMAGVVCRLGQDIPLIRSKGGYGYLKLSVARSLRFWLIISTTLILIKDQIFDFISTTEMLYSYWLACGSVIFICINHLLASYLKGLGKILESAFMITIPYAFSCVFYALFFDRLKISELILAGIAGTIISIFYGWYSIFRYQGEIENDQLVKDFKEESKDYFYQSLFDSLSTYINVYLSGYISPVMAANYSIANRIAGAANVPLTSLNHVLAPKLRDALLFDAKNEILKYHKLSSIVGLTITGTILLALYTFDYFLLDVYGSDYEYMIKILQVLMIGMLINAAFGSVGLIISMAGKSKFLRNLSVISSSVIQLIAVVSIVMLKCDAIFLAWVAAINLMIINAVCFLKISKDIYGK